MVSSGWSKPVWYLSATTRIRYSGFGFVLGVGVVGTGVGEPLRQLALGEAVDPGLGDGVVVDAGDRQLAGERDEHAAVVVAAGVPVGDELAVQAHGVVAGAGDDHRLRPAAQAAPDVVVEVVHDDLRALAEARGVQHGEPGELRGGLALVDLAVVGVGVGELPVRPVGDVVGQDVEDEPLLDGLAHRVHVERPQVPRRRVRVPNSSRVLAFGVAVNAK